MSERDPEPLATRKSAEVPIKRRVKRLALFRASQDGSDRLRFRSDRCLVDNKVHEMELQVLRLHYEVHSLSRRNRPDLAAQQKHASACVRRLELMKALIIG